MDLLAPQGYFGVYKPGHHMDSLHLDNHHGLMTPQRTVSFVIYMTTNKEGGSTVFPMAKAGKSAAKKKKSQPARQQEEPSKGSKGTSSGHGNGTSTPPLSAICGLDPALLVAKAISVWLDPALHVDSMCAMQRLLKRCAVT